MPFVAAKECSPHWKKLPFKDSNSKVRNHYYKTAYNFTDVKDSLDIKVLMLLQLPINNFISPYRDIRPVNLNARAHILVHLVQQGAGSIESLDSVLNQMQQSIKGCLCLSPCMKMFHLNLQAFNLFL
jgi:hypothetical protein